MALEHIAISIALGSVKLLLNEVLVEVGKPLWEGDKNAKMLRHLLQCIEPVISIMDAPGATPEQLNWLQKVEPCLKDIQMVLHTHEECKFTSKLGTSREIMKKMKSLCELCQTEVPVMTMHNSNVTTHNSIEILRDLSSMGELLKDVKEKVEGLELERDQGFQESMQVAGMATSCRHQDTYTTFGREHDNVVEVAIQELLVDSKATSTDDVECVGIWGLGGTGKTLAATRVLNKEEIQAHFTSGCYWVTVGNSKTSVPKLLGEIYKKMDPQHRAHVRDEDIKDELFRNLKGRERMLLVLDDVWKTQTLEILEVMPKGVQCKVLITTRNEAILNKIHATKLKMPNLSREESWKLFCHHACRGDANMPLDLEEVGRQITSECGGLPLALKVIGGYLVGSIDPLYWERTLDKLRNASMVSSDQYEELYSKLQLSVDELEKVHPRLKNCFFYFAAFPEDFVVGAERDLFPLWLGDQIVSKEDPMGDTKELLDNLVQRSLIEVHYGDKDHEGVYYVIHDVLRDLIRHMLQKLPLERRDCLYEAGQHLECFPEEYHKMSSSTQDTLSAQRLSIMDSKVEKLLPKLLSAPKLQVMILRGNSFEAIPAGFFSGNFRNLRVLDLSSTNITSLPKSVKNLKQLVVLDLRFSKLEKLSSSFVKAMTNLQVLNVHGCELEFLPSSIASLSKLQCLYAYSKNDLWKEVGWLRNALHPRATLADIMKLVLLEKLEISIMSQEVLPEGMFKALKHLRVLNLHDCFKLSAIPKPMEDELQHLQVLRILGIESLTSLPNPFGIVLKNLRDLDLSDCWGLLCLPEGLAGLPKLKNLVIPWCRGLECFPSSFSRPGAFPALKYLYMRCPSGRVSFPDLQPGAMPQLEHLYLQGWGQLVDFPKPIANLTKLRFLDLSDCGNLRSLEHDGVGVQSLANLEELCVSSSEKISTLPDGLEALPKLRRIDISRTKITFSQEVSHLVTRRYE